MKLLIKAIIIAVVVFILLRSCTPLLRGPHPLIGQPAPDFTLTTLAGYDNAMNSVRDGQPAILFFWATWCPHCRSQLAGLAQQRADIERKGIKIILVDVGEDQRSVRAYLRDKNISFNVFLDAKGVASDEYRVIGVPMFFFVNAQGTIIAAGHSLISDYEEALLGLAL